MTPQWLRDLRQFQYVPLFTVLVGVLFVHPYIYGETQPGGDWLLRALLSAIPAMAIVALTQHRIHTVLGLAFGVPATLAILFGEAAEAVFSPWVLQITPLAFYVYATAVICYHVVTEPRVRADTLIGAVCGYLMLGYSWGVAYGVLLVSEPNSLRDSGGGFASSVTDLFYFSFVTLTTLGYGDIVPVTTKARALAMMQSITGVLYLAVLVSRLVALYGKGTGERE